MHRHASSHETSQDSLPAPLTKDKDSRRHKLLRSWPCTRASSSTRIRRGSHISHRTEELVCGLGRRLAYGELSPSVVSRRGWRWLEGSLHHTMFVDVRWPSRRVNMRKPWDSAFIVTIPGARSVREPIATKLAVRSPSSPAPPRQQHAASEPRFWTARHPAVLTGTSSGHSMSRPAAPRGYANGGVRVASAHPSAAVPSATPTLSTYTAAVRARHRESRWPRSCSHQMERRRSRATRAKGKCATRELAAQVVRGSAAPLGLWSLHLHECLLLRVKDLRSFRDVVVARHLRPQTVPCWARLSCDHGTLPLMSPARMLSRSSVTPSGPLVPGGLTTFVTVLVQASASGCLAWCFEPRYS